MLLRAASNGAEQVPSKIDKRRLEEALSQIIPNYDVMTQQAGLPMPRLVEAAGSMAFRTNRRDEHAHCVRAAMNIIEEKGFLDYVED